MKKIKVFDYVGEFGENKDRAQKIRKEILLKLDREKPVELDFKNVSGATQSFIHAMIAEPIRQHPETFFELISFSHCSDLVKTVIEIVSEYMQESLAGGVAT